MSGSSRRQRKKKFRDFWRAWRDEHHRRWTEHAAPGFDPGFSKPPFPRPEKIHAWREFFHEFMGAWPEEHWAFGGRRFNPWHQGVDTFNPFVASLLSKGGGLLPLFVLHLLSQGPRYGNELMDLIARHTRGQWLANPGAIYPLMTMLEQRGLVAGDWEDPRKRTVRRYHLTDTGEQEMARLKAIVQPKLAEAVEVLAELASELNGEASDSSPGAGDAELD